MATLTVTIAGVDRTAYLCAPGAGSPATFDEALRERRRFSCEFLDRTGAWYPIRGQGITVTHSTEGVIFGGYISIATWRKAPGSVAIFTKITAVSYEQIMNRRLSIAFTWTGQVAGGIFNQIIEDSLIDEGFTTETETGPTIPLFDIQEPRPMVRDALDRLCELASNGNDIYYWDASPTKVARFFKQDTYPAPFAITDANPDVLESLAASVDETNQGIVNRVFVYLGQYLRDSEMQAFVGDSSTRVFLLDYPVGAVPALTLNTVAVDPADVGVENVDTGKQWYWSLGSSQIRQDDAETILTAGDDLEVTYQGLERRATAPFNDADSENYEGTIQGNGTGIYEAMLTIDNPATYADAATLAQSWLDRYSTATVTFQGSTYTAGLRSGQELIVDLTSLGIDLTMLIQSVTMTDAGAGRFLWTFSAIYGAARDDWKKSLLGNAPSTSISGAAAGPQGLPGDPGGSATAPSEFTIGTITHRWVMTDGGPVVELLVPVTPPSPIGTTQGGHLYLEGPDRSGSIPPFALGSSGLGGTDGVIGNWEPDDLRRFSYVATEQPWVVRLTELYSVSVRKPLTVRLYVEPYSETWDAAPIRNGETDETPNATVTIQPYASAKPSSGVNVTPFLVTSVTATASDPVTVSGRLLRPISVTVVLPADVPDNWAYQLVGYVNGDTSTSPVLGTGVLSPDVATDPVPAGEDGISTPHTFGNEEPAELQNITIFAVAGLIMSAPVPRGMTPGPAVFVPNNIVAGITAADDVSIGTTDGVLDPTEVIQDLLNSTMAVVNDLFGVAPLGIGETYVDSLAISTSKIQDAAIALAKLAALSVDTSKIIDLAVSTGKMADLSATAAKLASSSVTATKIDNLAVGTAAIANISVTSGKIQNLAVTNSIIDNLAVTNAKIALANIGTSLIANAAITNALIGNLAVANGNIQDLAVNTAKIADLAVTNAKIDTLAANKIIAGTISASITMTSPTLVITTGSVTVNIDSSNKVKVTDPTLGSYSKVDASGVEVRPTAGGAAAGILSYQSVTITDSSSVQGSLRSNQVTLGGNQIIGLRLSSVGSPSGGSVQDTESRNAIATIINRLQTHGLIS